MSNLILLKLLKETIEFADQKFLKWLETNIKFFSQLIDTELLKNE